MAATAAGVGLAVAAISAVLAAQAPAPIGPFTQKPVPQQPGTPPPPQVRPPAGQVPTQPQTPTGGQAQQPAPGASSGIGFRLENADLLQFISLVAGQLKLNYVVDPAVKGAATISTAGELRTEDLLPILESVLKMNGATAIKTGNFYRIVPLAQAPRSALQVFTDSTGQGLPKDDSMVMQIIPMRFVFAADMAKLLTPFLSEGGSVAVHDAGNVVILVDNTLNVKRLLEILRQFDSSAFAEQRVLLIPVHNNVASGLVPELQSIFSAYALSDKNTPLRFVPLDRINAILVAAADPAAFDAVQKWVDKLDQPAVPSGVQTFVYKVQNSEAGYLVRLLRDIRTGGKAAEASGGLGSTPSQSELGGESLGGEALGGGTLSGGTVGGGALGGTGRASYQRGALPAQRPTAGIGAEVRPGAAREGAAAAVTEEGASVVADPVSNSVIIEGTAQQYSEVVKTLTQLDVLPRQVLIEARVYEVTLTGELEFGLQYFLQENSGKPRNPLGSITSSGLQLQAGWAVGATRELFVFLNSSQNRSRVRVISAPTVLATDSSSARIQVGSQVPVLSSQAITAGAIAGSSSLFTNTITNVDTGVILNIVPRITSTGLVSLLISQEISSPVPPAAGAGIQSPSFTKRSVTTHAVAQDGQTIALGGLIQYQTNKTTSRVPLLGDIPVFGALFGSTSYSTSKTELIVLLTPRIISTLPSALDATRELRERLPELRRDFQKDKLMNPLSPQKPARTGAN